MRLGLATLALSVCLLGAAAEAQTSNSVTRSETQRAQPVVFGKVISVQNVTIRPGQTHLGTVTGAALGAIGGSRIGSGGAANTAGGIGGAVVGGAVGSAIQGSRTTQGIEVALRLDNGEHIAIIQPGSVRDFRPGDRVRVTGTADNARVSR